MNQLFMFVLMKSFHTSLRSPILVLFEIYTICLPCGKGYTLSVMWRLDSDVQDLAKCANVHRPLVPRLVKSTPSVLAVIMIRHNFYAGSSSRDICCYKLIIDAFAKYAADAIVMYAYAFACYITSLLARYQSVNAI